MKDDERRLFALPALNGQFDMLASVVSADVYSALHDEQSLDPARTRAALAALPGSWERAREEIPAERHANRAERRAAERNHRR